MDYLKYVPSMLLFVVAGYMGLNELSGWGWFLFVGVLTVPYGGDNESNQ